MAFQLQQNPPSHEASLEHHHAPTEGKRHDIGWRCSQASAGEAAVTGIALLPPREAGFMGTAPQGGQGQLNTAANFFNQNCGQYQHLRTFGFQPSHHRLAARLRTGTDTF
ncbi:hypothetical protein KUCAC02_000548 [Chaenocephalus aceratus]|uniref:Uncharacterized protein n=1 Tax=Chaenocephalus aceratus TaxID=36190 RepID=A0ACB9W6L2_CHAAC|nr:hypothetical protein KUCAC02_000548 [Chaenocephalus aceratus]